MGGKARVARKIAAHLKTLRQPGQLYVEPFVGAANILCEMNDGTGPCRAYDAHPDLICMWQAVQEGWTPPGTFSERRYKALRSSGPSALRAFVGFGCSFGAKFFGGWARSRRNPRGYCAEAKRSLMRKSHQVSGVRFSRSDYRRVSPKGALIYCDPPYAGTEGFRGAGEFDHSQFWEAVRLWSRDNTVIVSEAVAPADFVSVLDLTASGGLRFADGSVRHRRECLFQHRSQAGQPRRLTNRLRTTADSAAVS